MSENGTNGVKWASELSAKYAAGIAHQFVLHFNVQDYATGLVPVRDYLKAMFSKRDIVVTYDVAHGLQFAEPAQRKLFIQMLGLDKPEADGGLAGALGLPQQPQAQEVKLPASSAEALALLERALHISEAVVDGEKVYPSMAVIVDWAEQIAPAGRDAAGIQPADRANMVRLAQWAVDPVIRANRGIVVLITRNLQDLAEPLRASGSMIEPILVPLPDEQARYRWIREYVEANHVKMEAMAIEQMARATSILGLIHIEDIFLRAFHEGRAVDHNLVKARKEAIVSQEYGDVLETLEPRWGLDMIAGHPQAKAYFQDYVIEALREGDLARAPLGVLLTGPPGTGKTALVEAVAFEAGFNAVNLNLARILAGLVGASERNLEKALLAVEALAPVIVFTDEIDQKLGRRSEGFQGDSGVSARLFGRVMEFMSDTSHRGRIVWLAATNRPDLLDTAFKRPGRFDAKIPLLLPTTDDERIELFHIMFRKYGLQFDNGSHQSTEAKLRKAAQLTAGRSGAQLEAIVIKANQIAGRNRNIAGNVTGSDLLKAISLLRHRESEDAQRMTELALAECDDLEFVPEVYRT